MAVVSFWNNSDKETGQTLATTAIATYMAIEHNYKILEISTGFMEKTIEDCFWNSNDVENVKNMVGNAGQVAIDTGIEGLAKIIQSNRASSNIVANYAKVIFKNRFDMLPSPQTQNFAEYNEMTKLYPNIITLADRDYDLVIIDIDKKMSPDIQRQILLKSDVVVVTLTQGLKSLNRFEQLRQNEEFFRKKNIMVVIGRYDKFSKYNTRNVTRYLKEKREVSAVPYNTLFFEASTEGLVADYFLRNKNINDETDRNAIFIKETKKACDNIIYKLQELQMRM